MDKAICIECLNDGVCQQLGKLTWETGVNSKNEITKCVKFDSGIGTDKDKVNHPAHYLQGGRETIEIIKDITGEAFEGYLTGNILKYISRYKFKNGAEDLNKAAWYLNKLITEVEKND